MNRYMRRQEREALTEGTIQNSGYVVRTLEAALWAFGKTASFEEGCLLIANLGDDADTVAAVYGQVHACTTSDAQLALLGSAALGARTVIYEGGWYLFALLF